MADRSSGAVGKEQTMRYNPDDLNWIYDSRQYLTADEERGLIAEQRQQQISDGLRKLRPKNLAATPLQTGLGFLALLLFIGLIAGFVIALKKGHPAIGIMLFGSLFLIGGLMMLVSGKAESDHSNDTALGTRAFGLLFAVIGLLPFVSATLIPVIGPARALIGAVGAAFAWAGLFFSFDLVRQMLRARLLYGEAVPARCIGYARSVHHSKNSPSHLRTHEIFEYEYNGEMYQAINPVSSGRDAMMPVGEPVEVRIHPKRPDEPVYAEDGRSPVSSSVAVLVFFSLFVAVGIGLILFAAFGRVDDSDFKVYNRLSPGASQSTTENGKHALTDAVIQSQLGKPETEWNITKYRVTDRYQDEKYGYVIVYSDGSRHRASKEAWDCYETGMVFYQITDAETGKYLSAYNCESWEYTGEHTLADCTGSSDSGGLS